MKKRPMSWSIRQVEKMVKKTETMRLDHPMQREPGQWKKEAPSLLIDSIFSLYIPDFWILRKEEQEEQEDGKIEKKITNWTMDGVQRTTYLLSYINDEFTIAETEDTLEEKILESGETFILAGKKFSELPEEAQEEIMNYQLNFKILELEAGDDEEKVVKKLFSRINAGEKVSKAHMVFINTSPQTAMFVSEQIDNHDLFQKTLHFSNTDKKTSQRENAAMQTIVLAGDFFFKDLSNNGIAEALKGKEITPELLANVKKSYDMLLEAFPEHNSFLKKVHFVSFTNLIINSDFNCLDTSNRKSKNDEQQNIADQKPTPQSCYVFHTHRLVGEPRK